VARLYPRSPDESRTEQALDAALDATFPASDPVSMTQPGGDPEALGRILRGEPTSPALTSGRYPSPPTAPARG
jgi:hypothetical protein